MWSSLWLFLLISPVQADELEKFYVEIDGKEYKGYTYGDEDIKFGRLKAKDGSRISWREYGFGGIKFYRGDIKGKSFVFD